MRKIAATGRHRWTVQAIVSREEGRQSIEAPAHPDV